MTNPEPDPIPAAIAALTDAARGTKIVGAGTRHEQTEQADFADLVAHVLTSVAANLGGIESMLAGRAGSWEADLVRQLVQGTAPDDELARYRTVPLRIFIYPEGDLYDLGIMDLYEHDLDAAIAAEARVDLTEKQAAAAGGLVEAIERLWQEDLASYAAAYEKAASSYLAQQGITVGIEVLQEPAPQPGDAHPDALVEELHKHALRTAPLPMTGEAPDWSDGTPADALRRAGLTYTARARATQAPH